MIERLLKGRHRRKYEAISLLAVVLGVLAGCGGAQTPKVPPCQATYNELESRDEQDICSATGMSQYEIAVSNWRSECPELAHSPYDKRISYKMMKAQMCLEGEQRRSMKRQDCDSRLEEIRSNLTCLGEECSPFQKDMVDIEEDCDIELLQGEYKGPIAKLNQQLAERVTEVARLRALGQLIMLCDQFVEVPDNEANDVLNDVLDAVSVTPPMKESPEPGTEVANYRMAAADSCGQALLLATELQVKTLLDRLESNRVKSSKRLTDRYIGKLRELEKRMISVNGSELFPNVMASLDAALTKYDPDRPKNKPVVAKSPPAETVASGAEVKPTPTTEKKTQVASKKTPVEATVNQETPPPVAKTEPSQVEGSVSPEAKPTTEKTVPSAGGRSPQADREELKQHKERCKNLKKKGDQFASKVREYTKKKNASKVKAYESKLADTTEKQEALKAEINAIIQSTSIPAPELDKLKKQLQKAGCTL